MVVNEEVCLFAIAPDNKICVAPYQYQTKSIACKTVIPLGVVYADPPLDVFLSGSISAINTNFPNCPQATFIK